MQGLALLKQMCSNIEPALWNGVANIMIFDVRRFGIKYSIPDIGLFGLYKLTDSGVSIGKKCHVVKETASRNRRR